MSILGAREQPQTKFKRANDFTWMKAWIGPSRLFSSRPNKPLIQGSENIFVYSSPPSHSYNG